MILLFSKNKTRKKVIKMESNALVQRNFSVCHYQVSETLWLAYAELQDEKHNVVTKIEISVPDFKVTDVCIEFRRKPLNFCSELCVKVKQLIGTQITDINKSVNKLFTGPAGCPNIRILLDISGSSFIYSYYSQMIKDDRLEDLNCLEFFSSESRNNCISHRKTYENYIKDKK